MRTKLLLIFVLALLIGSTSCDRSLDPVPIVSEEIFCTRVPSLDENPTDFYLESIRPISADTAIFTLTNQRGSELVIAVWRVTPDSLGSQNFSLPWLHWLNCVSKWMTSCAEVYPPGGTTDYWRCVASSAVGCALGAVWMNFAFSVFMVSY
jgi:hypothetical protein